jgi:hypothetical protein
MAAPGYNTDTKRGFVRQGKNHEKCKHGNGNDTTKNVNIWGGVVIFMKGFVRSHHA